MHRLTWTALALAKILAVTAVLSPVAAAGPNSFEFIALGDMPYKIPQDYPRVDRLIAAINAARPAFSLHVGDIKSGSSPCSDEVLKAAYTQLQTFDGPLVYSIGDNEWTDCHRKDAGGFDPRERLKKVREIFFATPGQSLGKTPMAVETQSSQGGDVAPYVENQRFEKNGVLFVVPHVPGSNNGFEAQDPAAATEFFARDKANVAWLEQSFAMAKEKNLKALVISIQADFDESRLPTGEMPRQSGFIRTLNAIEAGARSFGKPVLLIHGDEHAFSVGALRNNKGKTIPGVTNLMVMGETEIHAVKITVDPDTAGVFGFTPLIVPENLDQK